MNLPNRGNTTKLSDSSSVTSSVSSSTSGNTSDTVETDGVVDEIQKERAKTGNTEKQAVTSDNEGNTVDHEEDEDDKPLSEVRQELRLGKSYFKTKSYELFKYKRVRTFKCLKCRHTEHSQKQINLHIRSNHGLLSCDICNKLCNTLSALRKHGYKHSDKAKQHRCDDCDKAFVFASQLKSHRKVHMTGLEHHCLHCVKSFKNKGELVKHQNVHSNKKWFCQEEDCQYECIDPRNLRAHMHSHAIAGRYKCESCGKAFKYYEQMKRHKTKGCDKQ